MAAFTLQGMTTLIEVFDMQRSIDFYRNTLGFEVHQSAGNEHGLGWAWLKSGDLDLMLNSMYNPGEAPATSDALRTRHHRDVCLYFGCPNVDAAYEYLKSIGVNAGSPTTASYGMRQCNFQDPDGYNICLQWPA